MSKRRNAITGILFILPSLVGILVFLIVPFLQSVYYTFTQGISDVKFVWFQNFIDLFRNPTFALAVKNTLLFMGVGIPTVLAVSLTLSLIMRDSHFAWAGWILLVPLIVPMASVIAGWRFMLAADGPIAGMLARMGLGEIDLFDEKYAMLVIILLYVWKNIGYLSVILTSAIVVIPKEYREAFLIESKSPIKLTLHVILPQILPMMFFTFVISTMNGFKAFKEIYVMYGSMPPKNIYMLQHFMNNNFFKLNYQRLSTAAFMLIGVLFVLIRLFLTAQNRYTQEMQGGR